MRTVALGGDGVDAGGDAVVEEATGHVMRPYADGRAHRSCDGGGDQAQPVAGEALGSGEGAAVDGAVARAVARDVTLEAAQHPDEAAVDAAERLCDEQLDVVALLARVGVVASVSIDAALARRVVEGTWAGASRVAAKDLPV